jgi:hypothetical protein
LATRCTAINYCAVDTVMKIVLAAVDMPIRYAKIARDED